MGTRQSSQCHPPSAALGTAKVTPAQPHHELSCVWGSSEEPQKGNIAHLTSIPAHPQRCKSTPKHILDARGVQQGGGDGICAMGGHPVPPQPLARVSPPGCATANPISSFYLQPSHEAWKVLKSPEKLGGARRSSEEPGGARRSPARLPHPAVKSPQPRTGPLAEREDELGIPGMCHTSGQHRAEPALRHPALLENSGCTNRKSNPCPPSPAPELPGWRRRTSPEPGGDTEGTATARSKSEVQPLQQIWVGTKG